jgi:hypothetical protein
MFGPVRIGLPSLTSTVRAQPLANASASTVQSAAIHHSVARRVRTFDKRLDPPQQRLQHRSEKA